MYHRKDPDIRSVLRDIAPNIRMFYIVGQIQFVLSLYTYIENVYAFKTPVEEFANIAGEEISKRAKEDIMTIAEQMMHRGIEKGKIELIKTMLTNGVDPLFIAKNTGVSISEIKEIQKQAK